MKFRILALISLFFSFECLASILITPTRVVFDERDRTQEVIIVNTSQEQKTYALSWVEMEQNISGGYNILSTAQSENFATASKHIRFSPRRLTLQPGENQRVKLSLRRSSDMNKPEYRSHLKFTLIPNSVLEESQEKEQVEGVSVKLNLFLNYTIPVLIKRGDIPSNVSISNVQLLKDSYNRDLTGIKFALGREAGVSVIGDITISFKSANSNVYKDIGFNNNVSIYHELDRRLVNIPFEEIIGGGQTGELKISFKGKSESVDIINTETFIRI